MVNHYPNLNAEKALIWRIVHRDNLSWILEYGLHCGNSGVSSDNWVHIGNPELTEKRATHPVPISPWGSLNDYVPFYFTPFSVMLKNIHSGWGGIQRRSNDEIIILVSSLPHLQQQSIPFVYTNSHAYYAWTEFYRDLTYLDKIDWPLLQARDFKRDPDDPGKFERYQAEALVHKHCPVSGLLGLICYTEAVKLQCEQMLAASGIQLPVHARTEWYFS